MSEEIPEQETQAAEPELEPSPAVAPAPAPREVDAEGVRSPEPDAEVATAPTSSPTTTPPPAATPASAPPPTPTPAPPSAPASANSKTRIVVAVKLRYNPKAYWFDPVLSSYKTGDHVLVDTERGREIGLVTDCAVQVTEKQVKDLKTPLKPVIRALGENDFDRVDELDAKGRTAMPIFRKLVEKHALDMKPVSVEYLFSGDKAVFYFSSDERVDFRDLVRELASQFHIRIDMRQIGVRDEARILGGLAHCGEEICCARLGGEFQPVSIRMAKEQDLPLNPTKISGACGRLMCCLRYEFEAYKDFKNRAPKKGAIIETPLGLAKVIDFDTPREVITLRLEDGKQLAIPLSEFEYDADESGRKRPCRVGRDAIDRCASSSIILALAALEQELVQQSGGPAGKERAPREPREARGRGQRDGRDTRGQRDGREPGASREAGASRAPGSARGAGGAERGQSTRRPRRANQRGGQEAPAERQAAGQGAGQAAGQRNKPRPGQHSSGLRNAGRSGERSGAAAGASDRSGNRVSSNNRAATSAQPGGPPETRSGDGRRRRRRRPDDSTPSAS